MYLFKISSPLLPGTAFSNDWGVNFDDSNDQLLLSCRLIGLPEDRTLRRLFKETEDIKAIRERLDPSKYQPMVR